MFIELTDHLRCPEDHDEAYLVLLPSRMRGRSVEEGELGCPVCGRAIALRDGIVDFGGGEPGDGPSILTAPAAHALLGLSGPGGYLALLGAGAILAPELEPLLPGVALVAVNPPAVLPPGYPASVLRARRLPLKTACLRGAVVGAGLGAEWVRDAARAVLPGLRVVGEGNAPEVGGLEILATGGGIWVGRKVG